MSQNIIVGLIAIAAGVVLIIVGLGNVRTQQATESGSRRGVNRALGASNTYEGSKAVRQGYIRVGMGAAAIIFGLIYLVVGPSG